MVGSQSLVPSEKIQKTILLIRQQKVMLDADLAELYGVETKILVRAVKRNIARFPADFMFQLSKEEFDDLRFHFGTSSERGGREESGILRSQIVTSSDWGGRRYPPCWRLIQTLPVR